MSATQSPAPDPDLTQGIPLEQLADGHMLAGHVGDDAVILVRRGNDYHAIGATCSHYGGPLAEGLVVGDTVRCPWHHACFSLRTGEATAAPAFNPVACWRTEVSDGKVMVRDKIGHTAPRGATADRSQVGRPERVVIVGGGGAGFAAAEMLRRDGFAGSLTLVSAEDAAPYDRPNCSKDYLAGTASEEWMPLRPPEFYREQSIELHLRAEATALDATARQVTLADGRTLPFDRLLLATGAEPIRLDVPGVDRPHVHLLRSLGDSRAIIAGAQAARHAVVIGSSFIGLEVAAALRIRGLEVHVVAPDRVPLERVLGPEVGAFVRALHEERGVVFHLEDTVATIGENSVQLNSGRTLPAELVVVGIGVRPRVALAERAGLNVERGVMVNDFLETSAPGIFAAGDIARWPDHRTGGTLRVEHWVVAERQGQVAARNILGAGERFSDVPFFWSQHYDVPINYVGHAEKWDRIEIDGDLKARDCLVRYRGHDGTLLAVASIFRDLENLTERRAMEQNVAAAIG
jgi:NADPH-dependent 2,4-dienoyl-CoA reductase/sulfur reductase-like enzyme/nitrite reductase/ring-hydroxylating ferredoxin subunit